MTLPSQPDPPATPADEPVMEDFVFGGIEADAAGRLAQTQARAHGIRHLYQLAPADPLPAEAVSITAQVGPDIQVDRMTLYYTVDGSDPAGHRGVATNGLALPMGRVAVHWEPLLWSYVEQWQVHLPGQPAGTLVQYRIEGWQSHDPSSSFWSREQNLDRTPEQPARYAYHVDRLAPPAWARDAVIYHIFVDRFASGGNQGAGEGMRRLPAGWLEPAELNDFAGGNLPGVIERLDYIAELGVSAIWLSPVFRTPSYHGYDTTDFYTVDPRFGTNEELRMLVQAAHARGLRVILDFVANHTSTAFAPFVAAQLDPTSPQRAWFHFDQRYRHGYRAFFDVATMPQLDTDQPAARRFLIEAACHWLAAYDVDGYRLDYAAGPSHAFWSEFRAACCAVKADCWLFGEVTLAGDALRAYTGHLDGCLDFAFCRLLRQLCAGPQPTIALTEFVNAVERSRAFFGLGQEAFLLPSFLDNHDMNRFLWVAGNDKGRLRLAAGLLFALGGPPILYYGTEVGLSQPRGKGPWREEARHPMVWGEAQDGELLRFFQQLVAARRCHLALGQGELTTLQLDEERGIWLVELTHADDRVLLAVNVGGKEQVIGLPAGQFADLDATAVCQQIQLAGKSLSLLFPRGQA